MNCNWQRDGHVIRMVPGAKHGRGDSGDKRLEGLASGKDTAAALTEAKRSVVRTFGTRALPYHWGAFVLERASKPI